MSKRLLALRRDFYTLSSRRLCYRVGGAILLALLVLLLGLGGWHRLAQQRLQARLVQEREQMATLRVQLLVSGLQVGLAAVEAALAAARQAQCSPARQARLSWQTLTDGQRQVSASMTFHELLQTLESLAACEQRVVSLMVTPAAPGVHVVWVVQEGK